MPDLTDKLKSKVKTILYEKAKEEARSYISGKFNAIKNKIRSFFGFGESRQQRLERIGKFYTTKKDLGHQNLVMGVVELYTLNYVQTMAEMMSHSVREKPEQEHLPEQEK